MNYKNFIHRHNINRWPIFAVIILSLCLLEIFILLIRPASRIGPFGIPAKMVPFQSDQLPFIIDYPESWQAVSTPGGNHGDLETVARISVPTTSVAYTSIASKKFSPTTLERVVEWGAQRAQTMVQQQKGYEFSEIRSGEINTLKGMKGQYRTYSWKSRTILGEYIYQCMDSYFIHENTGFAIRQCAEQKNWEILQPMYQDMINSFHYHESQ